MSVLRFIFCRTSALRIRLGICTTALTIVGSATTAQAVGSEATVAEMRPAVVFILLPLAQETGSGVVVRTDDKGSYIVTAAHVVSLAGTSTSTFRATKAIR